MSFAESLSREIHSLPELKQFWQELLPLLKPQQILLMVGDVGAGKTTSVQFISQILGMKDAQSPSFAIHLRYENAEGRRLDHLDMYRLKDDDDLESSGFWDLFAQDQSLIVIEWAQRLDYEFLPMNWPKLEIKFEKLSEDSRRLTVRQP